jgi:hypothetical protein
MKAVWPVIVSNDSLTVKEVSRIAQKWSTYLTTNQEVAAMIPSLLSQEIF